MKHVIVKYFGLIIDHPGKNIIYGESGIIYKLENIGGYQATIYKTSHGFESELEQARKTYPMYSLITAGLMFSVLLPKYMERVAELRSKGMPIEIDQSLL
ncbi:hypothetical protein [Paenibacillus sp. YYML68]|uniref:hypothetical protein n=1 Tax=Paenibacillus sp. YYML68 TaxID=2909250 RepID=UPI00248F7B09|nr:hypothetical protein [Paenibacillus sp. YYML68]